MKITTWNVNSIKARLPRLLEFLDTHAPDVVCLQETKSSPEQFPHEPLAEAGYVAADHSKGRWAGVAILSPRSKAPTDMRLGLPGTPLPDDARWIEATVEGIRFVSVYVVNGRSLEDPMYDTKLAFLDAMAARVKTLAAEPLVVTGDFNIAPADVDVWDPARLEGGTHVSDAERARLRAILDAGVVDAFRALHPEEVGFTWWDYRAGHFHRGMGLRIDLTLVSPDLARRVTSCGIDRSFRKGPKPSDHAPLLTVFDGT